jgi:hypothetical protein
MSNKTSNEPLSLTEVEAIIQVYEALHGTEQARLKIRPWAADKCFTTPAYDYIIAYIWPAKPTPLS